MTNRRGAELAPETGDFCCPQKFENYWEVPIFIHLAIMVDY